MLRKRQLATLRRQNDPSTSKSWRLSPQCTVEAPRRKAFNVVRGEQEKTVWAVLTRSSEHAELVRPQTCMSCNILRLYCGVMARMWAL